MGTFTVGQSVPLRRTEPHVLHCFNVLAKFSHPTTPQTRASLRGPTFRAPSQTLSPSPFRRTAQNFALLFLARYILSLSSSLGGPFVEFWNSGTLEICTFGVLVLSFEAPRRPPREGRKNEHCGKRREKSAKFWASHPSGPHPSGPPPSGWPHPSGGGLKGVSRAPAPCGGIVGAKD